MPTLPPLPMKRSKQSDKLVAAFAASVAANEFGHNIVKVAIGRLTYRYADAEMKGMYQQARGRKFDDRMKTSPFASMKQSPVRSARRSQRVRSIGCVGFMISPTLGGKHDR